MSKWANIPCNVFFRIVNRLFYDNIIISGVVCKSWHSLLNSLEKFPLPPSCPWLMLAEQNEQSDSSNNEQNETCRARLVCVFKNWKLLFKKICGNTCGWKSVLKCVKCCLKTENCCSNYEILKFMIWSCRRLLEEDAYLEHLLDGCSL